MHDNDLNLLYKRFGDKLPIFLEAMARGKQFAQAIDTPIGKELLSDATNSLEDLIEKVIKEVSTPEERAEIRALRKIINAWSFKINEYQNKQKEFTKITGA